MTYSIACIPGDGIGKEVVPEAQRVLESVATKRNFSFRWETFDWGCEYYLRHGRMMPENGLAQVQSSDGIFLGAVGYPGVPDHVSLWGLLIPIRRTFQQRINLRPIRLFRGIESPLRRVEPADVDFTVVRENNEGEYSEIGGRIYQETDRETVVQQSIFTRYGVDKVMRYAYELAQTRQGRLLSATKSNGIVHTMPFWDEMFRELGASYPAVETEESHIDALAARFVLRPETLDVVVASNLFGDILSDLGAAVGGSIGIAPSANLDPLRKHPSMFEPVHGSAPDIAGRGLANPLGQIWAGAMMLAHLGQQGAADSVVGAIESVLGETRVRTPDLGGEATTTQVTDAVLDAL